MSSTTKKRTVRPVNADATKVDPKPVKKVTLKASPEKVAKPVKATPPTHKFDTSWAQPSTVLNARASRTAINFSTFGSLTEAPLTDRDRKSLADLRKNFQKGTFARGNLDTGILKRLGERGYIDHVDGSDVSADATFKLTPRAFTKEAMSS